MFAGRMKTTESLDLLVFLTLKCHLALWKRVAIIKNSHIYSPVQVFALLHVSESVISVWWNILNAIQAKGHLQITAFSWNLKLRPTFVVIRCYSCFDVLVQCSLYEGILEFGSVIFEFSFHFSFLNWVSWIQWFQTYICFKDFVTDLYIWGEKRKSYIKV